MVRCEGKFKTKRGWKEIPALPCSLCLNKSIDDTPVEQDADDLHLYGGRLAWRAYAVKETLENGATLWIRMPIGKKCLPCHNVLRGSGILATHKSTKKYLKWSEGDPVRHHKFLECRKNWIKRHARSGLARCRRGEMKKETVASRRTIKRRLIKPKKELVDLGIWQAENNFKNPKDCGCSTTDEEIEGVKKKMVRQLIGRVGHYELVEEQEDAIDHHKEEEDGELVLDDQQVQRKMAALLKPFHDSSPKKALTVAEVQKRVLEARKAMGQDVAADSGADGSGEDSDAESGDDESDDEEVGLFKRASSVAPKKAVAPKKKVHSPKKHTSTVPPSSVISASPTSPQPKSQQQSLQDDPVKSKRGRPSKDAPPKGIVDMTGHMETCKEELEREIEDARDQAKEIFQFSSEDMATEVSEMVKLIKPVQAQVAASKANIEKYKKWKLTSCVENAIVDFDALQKQISKGLSVAEAFKSKSAGDAAVKKAMECR